MPEWQPFHDPVLFSSLSKEVPAIVLRGVFSDLDDHPERMALWRLGLDQLEAVMGGRVIKVPRLEAWWGSRPYRFGGRTVQPRTNWPIDLLEISARVEQLTEQGFDSCFANYYRDGDDSIAWHADDDSWIGPVIACVSFGATRRFWLRRKSDHAEKACGHLNHGDLIVMQAGCQKDWEHSVPRESRTVGPRLSLTFRQTID